MRKIFKFIFKFRNLKCKLYKLSLAYIGEFYKAVVDYEYNLQYGIDILNNYSRLTYYNQDKAYLNYGADNEWKNMYHYEVIDNAIQKLAMYEDMDMDTAMKEETR